MKIYSVIINRYDILDTFEVFDSKSDAIDFIMKFSSILYIHPTAYINQNTELMGGTVVVHDSVWCMSILEREISMLKSDDPLVSYGHILDAVAGKSVLMGDPVAVTAPQPVDDPLDPELPAGFHIIGNRPLKIKDIINDPHGMVNPVCLTQGQMWALATARVMKRPNFSYELSGEKFNQSKALTELKSKSSTGDAIRQTEMAIILDYQNKLINEQSSEDPQYYDEASSDFY